MCKNAYEWLSEKTDKVMIYCKLKEDCKNELERLCLGQYYCSEKDKYCERNQKVNCKKYES